MKSYKIDGTPHSTQWIMNGICKKSTYGTRCKFHSLWKYGWLLKDQHYLFILYFFWKIIIIITSLLRYIASIRCKLGYVVNGLRNKGVILEMYEFYYFSYQIIFVTFIVSNLILTFLPLFCQILGDHLNFDCTTMIIWWIPSSF